MNTKDLLLRRRMMMDGGSPLPPPPDMLHTPLTFEAVNDNTVVKFMMSEYAETALTIEASTDGGETWNSVTATQEGALVATLVAGGKVLLRGENEAYGDYYDLGDKIAFFDVSDKYYAYGNMMSLIGGSDFADLREIGPSAFYHFFFRSGREGDQNLLSKEGHPLLLPATTLAEYCYTGMFKGCTSLTEGPELPATTLAEGCYQDMFRFCSSLVKAPVLPATTLVHMCYVEMFDGCTELSSVKCLITDTSGLFTTNGWLNNVSASGTFTKAAGVEWSTGNSGIPSGWTVVEV